MKKQILIEEQTIEQSINFNGNVQSVNVLITTISCPNCKQILMKEQGPKLHFIKGFAAENSHTMNYCIYCGQELDYPVIIDGECKYVEEETKEDVKENVSE